MFTGLIQGQGRIAAMDARTGEARLRIEPLFELPGGVLGESIAVNGVCLTVEEHSGGGSPWFSVYASTETLSRSNLGGLKPGSLVNLERALALGDRLGGHLVSGHVDRLGTVESVTPAGQSREYRIGFPGEYGNQVVAKGSAALDGISLTVNACGPDWLTVNIIPKTLESTTMGQWQAGYRCNVETDLIGKYVLRGLQAWQTAGETDKKGITMDFLREHGF